MKPIRTAETEGIYGAPPGHDDVVGGLPYRRQASESIPGCNEIVSVWEPSAEEREAIASGANLEVTLVGEPIQPIALKTTELEAIAPAPDRPTPKPSPDGGAH